MVPPRHHHNTPASAAAAAVSSSHHLPSSNNSSSHYQATNSHHSYHHRPQSYQHYNASSSSARQSVPRSTRHSLPKNPKEQFKRRGSEFIRKVSNKDRYNMFLEPVDLELVPGYTDVIARPMDLSLVQRNMDAGVYRTPMDLRADIDLIWSNCCTFNPVNSPYYREAVRLRALSIRLYDEFTRHLIRDGVAASLGIHPPTSTPINPNHIDPKSIINNLGPHNDSNPSNQLKQQQDFHHNHHQHPYHPSASPTSTQLSKAQHPNHSNKRLSFDAHAASAPSHGSAGTNYIYPSSDDIDAGFVARHIQAVRSARLNLKSATEAASVAKIEVTQTARKAGISPAQCLHGEDQSDDVQSEPSSKPPPPNQIFNGPANLIKKRKLLEIYQAPHKFPVINSNPLLRDSAQSVPRAWARIGRTNPGLPPPFLSRARAADVRNGRRYAKYVSKHAHSARRLLATVLDVSVVDRIDRKQLASATCHADRRRKRDGDDHSGVLSMEIEKPKRENVSNSDRDFLAALVGDARAKKAARRMAKQEDQLCAEDVHASATQIGQQNLASLGELLKSQRLPTEVLDSLAEPCTEPNGKNGQTINGHASSHDNFAMGGLLKANYQGMLNCLRLRALRDAVNEAEREELEDRERECVECVAKGVAKAVAQLPPKMLVHEVDATESALNLCSAIQTSCVNGNT